jgi:hypothetical protein
MRTIGISIELDIDDYEDLSGLTDDQFSQQVYDLVEDERNELATAARIIGHKLMEGMTPDQIRMERE